MAQLGRVRRAGTALVLALSTLVFGACARQTPAPPAVQPTAAPEQTEPLDAFLWGTWYNLEDENCRYEFAPEGTVTIFTDSEERTVPYRFVFTCVVYLGAVTELETVWAFASALNGLMALPNLLCLLALSGEVARDARAFQPTVERERQTVFH